MSVVDFLSAIKEKVNTFVTKLSVDAEYRNTLLRSVSLLLFVSICGAVLYFASNNPQALGSDTFKYIIIVVISLIIIVAIFMSNILSGSNPLQLVLLFSLSLGFICAVAYSFIQLTSQSVGVINYMLNGLVILGLIVGLGLLFLAIGNGLRQQKGWVGFIVNLIFYVPCLAVDYIRYLTREFKTTVNYVYVLYAVEIAIILSYVYLPKLVSYLFLSDGDSILAEPMYLDTHKSFPLGSLIIQDRIGANDLTAQNQPPIYRSSYGLTMWLYINSQTSIDITKETPVMNFGNGKPRMTYIYDNTNSMKPHSLKVYFTNNTANNNEPAVYSFNLPTQKWSFIAFNYTANLVDFFVNGKLEYTFRFNQSNMPTFSGNDMLELGSNNGVNGSVCNVKYYKQNLTRGQIANAYNVLSLSNPPVPNL